MMRIHAITGILVAGIANCLAPPAIRAEPPAPGPNPVLNPGFEEGLVDGNPAHWGQQAEREAQGTIALAEGVSHGGRFSILVDHTNEKGYLHPSQNLKLPPGTYLYRAWARSDADVTFTMQIYDTRSWTDGPKPADLQVGGMSDREFKLRKDAWQRCEMTVNVTAEFPCSLQIGLRQGGRLWLDDVELVPTEPLLVLADTGGPHPKGLSAEDLARREGWRIIRDRETPIAGDAWLGNRHVGIAFRKDAAAAEYCALMPGGNWKKLSDLTPIGRGGDAAKAIQSFRVHENYPDKVALDVTFATARGGALTVRYKLQQDRRHVETEARDGAARVAATCGSKFAVIPDSFGGDIVINAERTAGARLRLPRERMLLQFVENGDAILMFVWLSPDQAAAVTLAGEGGSRVVAGAEIDYRRDQRASVWIAALAAPAIWHQKRIIDLTDIQGNKLDRTLPFDAGWRVDFRRQQDGLIDSWEPTFKNKDGNWEHCRENGSRTMWTSCRDDVAYPAFVQDGSMHLVNTPFPGAMRKTFFRGAEDLNFDPADVALVYPWERNGATPAEVSLASDILRQALEATPEFQLHAHMAPEDMARHRYPATCAVTGEYEKAFEQGDVLNQRRKLIDDLRRMDFFVLTKRERIEEYMSWMRKEREWLARQKAGNAALAPFAERLDLFLARIDDTYNKGRGAHMKTPADCQALVDKVEALLDSPTQAQTAGTEAPDAFAIAQDLGKQTRTIGGAQDGVLGCMRQIVKEMRQTAGHAMLTSKDDAEFNCARAMREATMELLWQTCGHEWR